MDNRTREGEADEYTLVSFHKEIPVDIAVAVPADIKDPEKWAEKMVEEAGNYETWLAYRGEVEAQSKINEYMEPAWECGWEIGDQTGNLSRDTLSGQDVAEGLLNDVPCFLGVLTEDGSIDHAFAKTDAKGLFAALCDGQSVYNIVTGDLYVPFPPFSGIPGEIAHATIDVDAVANLVSSELDAAGGEEPDLSVLMRMRKEPSEAIGHCNSRLERDRKWMSIAKEAIGRANGYERGWVTSIEEIRSILLGREGQDNAIEQDVPEK